jgi:hypothetical protein
MGWNSFTLSEPVIGPDGRYQDKQQVLDDVKRNHPTYIRKSLERLAVLADVPFSASKKQVCRLIQAYGHLLPDLQRQALIDWCQK